MKRIMGLDVGDKYIGVAVSDLLKITAQGLTTINRDQFTNEEDIFEEIEILVKSNNVDKIVVGLPKNMNGSIGPQGEKVKKFTKNLKKKLPYLEIEYIDERLTTVSAERILIEGDVSRKNRKKIIDKVAATYILQFYLDSN